MAAVCKRTCCDFLSGMGERFLEKGLEEEVVDLSRSLSLALSLSLAVSHSVSLSDNESGHWCEVSVCVFACFCSVCACSDFACEIGV